MGNGWGGGRAGGLRGHGWFLVHGGGCTHHLGPTEREHEWSADLRPPTPRTGERAGPEQAPSGPADNAQTAAGAEVSPASPPDLPTTILSARPTGPGQSEAGQEGRG